MRLEFCSGKIVSRRHRFNLIDDLSRQRGQNGNCVEVTVVVCYNDKLLFRTQKISVIKPDSDENLEKPSEK